MMRLRTLRGSGAAGILLAGLLCLGARPLMAAPPPPPTPVVAYRQQLQDLLGKLRVIEKHRPRVVAPILKQLEQTASVKREDGAVQQLSDEEWQRLAQGLKGGAPVRKAGSATTPALPPGTDDAGKGLVSDIRSAVEQRLRALDEWTAKPGGNYYTEADAKTIASQLESSGQIRTGPTWLQRIGQQISQAISNFMKAIQNWLNSLMPKSAPKAPNYDWKWVTYFFYAIVAALLAAILWMIWRELGGRWNRARTTEDPFEGEDAELLLLPPSELRSRAQQYADEGNFREALRHRYLALLLTLDSRGVWRHDPRRTNWEHIGLLRRNEEFRPLVAPLSDLTRRFDRVRYGGAACSREEWEQFDGDTAAIEAKTGQVVRV